jgi:L-amino acid N-acyltransferase YncA
VSEDVSFEYYQESDAKQVADLISKNRFHAGRHKWVTEEDYLFTQRSRGVHFAIVAKKNDKIIGIAGAYPSSDQHVAKKHQVYVGTFLVDMQYRLSYSIIMGLYEGLMKGLAQSDFREILSGVRPENEASYHLMLKCGFMFVDSTPNDFGRLGMRNYSVAVSKFLGAAYAEVSSDTFFSILPVVDRREARKREAKQRLHEKYIESEYTLAGQSVNLLFDIVNLKIDGAVNPGKSKIYPVLVHRADISLKT